MEQIVNTGPESYMVVWIF